MRNDRRREGEPERSAHRGDRPPAPRDRTRGPTCPRSPAGEAASGASMPATWGNSSVRAVAVEEIALNVGLARLLEKIKIIGPEIRVIAFDVGIVADMADFTLSGQRGTVRGRSSCARKPRPLFRADRFQSWDARRLVRRSLMCPLRQLGFRRPSLEDCDFR